MKTQRQPEEEVDIGFALHNRYAYYADEISPCEYYFWECYYDNKFQLYVWEYLSEFNKELVFITGKEFRSRKVGETINNLVLTEYREEQERREEEWERVGKRLEKVGERERELSELIYLAGIPLAEDPRISMQLRREQQKFY
ncbi:MAG: hypothetical protein WC309_03255 [Candidatus Paceibacterota bacterium]